jgi:hypothetical protein
MLAHKCDSAFLLPASHQRLFQSHSLFLPTSSATSRFGTNGGTIALGETAKEQARKWKGRQDDAERDQEE